MKRHIPTTLLIAAAVVLVFGIFRLFTLRLETGDVYPAYSSFRADPLGTMAFYESLQRLPRLNVRRDLSTLNRLPEGPATTYLHLAASLSDFQAMPQDVFKEVERFVNNGGRLVVTMFPTGARPTRSAPIAPVPEKPEPPVLRDRWGIDFDVVELEKLDNIYLPESAQNVAGLMLPQTLEWHSGIVLKGLHPDWMPIYVREMNPVLAHRSFGRGSVVIATDSFFLSNEAMLLDRHADLLAFLIGSSGNVMFDEAHLGITESPGIATLMRRYRLYWVAASLILVALLFIWKMSMPLIPPHRIERRDDYVEGKDATAGIINLLRRSIPVSSLLEVCFNEWKKSAKSGAYSASRIQEAEAAFRTQSSAQGPDRNVVEAYRAISKTLQTRIQ
jgi:hypothetical protein